MCRSLQKRRAILTSSLKLQKLTTNSKKKWRTKNRLLFSSLVFWTVSSHCLWVLCFHFLNVCCSLQRRLTLYRLISLLRWKLPSPLATLTKSLKEGMTTATIKASRTGRARGVSTTLGKHVKTRSLQVSTREFFDRVISCCRRASNRVPRCTSCLEDTRMIHSIYKLDACMPLLEG